MAGTAAIVTLNRPAQRNALSMALMTALDGALAGIDVGDVGAGLKARRLARDRDGSRRDPNRPLALRGPPREDETARDGALRRRSCPGERVVREALDEGPRRRPGRGANRRPGPDPRGRPPDRIAGWRPGRSDLLRRPQPAPGRRRGEAGDQGDPGRGSTEQASPAGAGPATSMARRPFPRNRYSTARP